MIIFHLNSSNKYLNKNCIQEYMLSVIQIVTIKKWSF